jgi:replicative DNA helicase
VEHENGRLPPCDLDAERALLGSMMAHKRCIDEVLPLLPEGSALFALPIHGTIYAHLVAAHISDKPMDLIVLADQLRRTGDLDAVGGESYLVELSESFAEWANAPHYAGLVRTCYQARACIQVADKLWRRAYEDMMADPVELCAEAQTGLDAILQNPSGERMVEIRSVIPTLQAAWSRRKSETIRTGYARLDSDAGGFERPSMVVIGARPSAGKTALALALCLQAARQDIPVLFVSLETTARRIAERLTAMLCGYSVRSSSAASPDEQAHRLRVAADKITGAAFYVVDQVHSRSLRELLATCRSLCRRHKIGLIAVDYLQLVSVDGRVENRTQEVTKISAALKDLAIRTNAVVLALSQLHRGPVGVAPGLGSLRESGAIEQDADMVILLHREELDETNEERTGAKDRRVAFMLAKNKDGPTFTEAVKFNAPTMLFYPNVGTETEPTRGCAIGMGAVDDPY